MESSKRMVREVSVLGAGLVVLMLSVLPAAAQERPQQVDVSSVGYTKGNPRAPIVIIEFGDFGCSACGLFASDSWPAVQREYIDTGKIYWRYIPFVMGQFRHSDKATRAAECAGEQDAFWRMHDRLYQERKTWMRSDSIDALLLEYAVALGLERISFNRCYQQNRRAQRMARSNEIARQLQIRGTPTFFVNGQRAVGAIPIDTFREVVRRFGG
jgi:protein-disulfide isomerase